MTSRDHDLVVYGASGFVGRLTAAYLAAHAPGGVRIALAGRSAAKLAAVRNGLGPAAADWPLVVADSADRHALSALASSTTAVATTVGPYARYGAALVAACAETGTHYADLTGEILFVRDSIDAASGPATRTGARIVHACGYDSVPSDLGVLLLHRRAADDGAGGLTETVLEAEARGGFSGGTIDSFRAQVDALAADRSRRAVVDDPYSLSPDRAGEPDVGPQPDAFAPRRDPLLGEWSAPFVMGAFNARIVRRSNALTGWAYGEAFRYREIMAFGRRPAGAAAAAGVTGALAVMAASMGFGPTRAVLDRLLPKPGSGPSQATMDRGHFRSTLETVTGSGRRYRAVVAADGDPGYQATAVMLGESALALALDGDRLPDAAGVLTPATAIGTVLVDRLRAAGFTMDVEAVTT